MGSAPQPHIWHSSQGTHSWLQPAKTHFSGFVRHHGELWGGQVRRFLAISLSSPAKLNKVPLQAPISLATLPQPTSRAGPFCCTEGDHRHDKQVTVTSQPSPVAAAHMCGRHNWNGMDNRKCGTSQFLSALLHKYRNCIQRIQTKFQLLLGWFGLKAKGRKPHWSPMV